MVSWETRLISWVPRATSCSTSRTMSSIGRERCLPRMDGMMQKLQVREQPSAIFT